MSTTPTTTGGPQPINEAMRRRLQSWFQHGNEKLAAGSHDYATDLFIQCVIGDPGSLEYQRAFLSNLHKKYKNNKKGASFAGFKGGSHKSALKKALTEKNYPAAVKAALELLKINPWDDEVLLQISTAVGEMQYYDTQLGYLKAAMDAAPKDAEVARACARALAYLGDFDQAIAMWHKVENLDPADTNAPREISMLQSDKLAGRAPKRPAAAGPAAQSKMMSAPPREETKEAETARIENSKTVSIQLTKTQMLQRSITEFPLDWHKYFELADHYADEDKFVEAERVLKTALDMSGRDLKVLEKIEDLLMRRENNKIAIAERRAKENPTDDNLALAQRLKLELARQEMEIYRGRSDRYPNETVWKYELGVRLKRLGNHHEAIKAFQAARHDPERRGLVLMELAESLQTMKQFQPALVTYQKAIDSLSDNQIKLKKTALYRAGLLAGGLKELALAEKYLSQLIGLDFNYKDAAERLDKIQKLRHK